MTNNQMDFLKTVYKECNEHAREQPKRRDSIITIYLAVYAAYITFIVNSNDLSKYMSVGLVVAMSIFSFMCALTVINFRCWAVQYVSCAQALAALLIDEMQEYTPHDITNKLWRMIERKSYSSKAFFKRTENIIVVSFVLLTSTPIITIIDRLTFLNSLGRILVIASYMTVYISVLFVLMVIRLTEADSGNLVSKNKTKFPPWIINFNIVYQANNNNRFEHNVVDH